ncbi:hypothetical protein ACSBR2_012445 [Camellia fascicularis]
MPIKLLGLMVFLLAFLGALGMWWVKDIVSAIKSFFTSGDMLKEVNSTPIALVPKVPNPSKVVDYGPISCCNALNKCIAKILANKVKAILPGLIDPVLSTFV